MEGEINEATLELGKLEHGNGIAKGGVLKTQ